ncbi:unnamed protein product [Periconia digitata]|uniref:BTB domain-containing protein n=1 Tax=Periconia digitata TaxID=1303443 RepID=A0A9W4XCZ0_9PLEO|nr:unnamed protein product [Periconia digitata]
MPSMLQSFPFPPPSTRDGASDDAAAQPTVVEAETTSVKADDAPATNALATRCPGIPVRPALAHRLNSHRLHVRAKAKLQRDRLLSGPMLDVYVGEDRRHWALHRNLLCHHSELLEAELQGEHGKKKNTLELPDHDPAGFALLVKWLYQGQLDDVSEIFDSTKKYEYAVSCHKLYLLCDRFDMPQLKNVAMDQYRKGLNQAELVPDADEIDDIYRNSPRESPFRRLMTRIAARQIMDPDNNRDVETYRECFENNPDFAVDLVNAIKRGAGGILFDDPTDRGNECEYHDHMAAGSSCHIQDKGKGKQAFKASASLRVHTSAKSAPKSENFVLPLHRRPPTPLLMSPPPPPRQARLQDGLSTGPLRRRLTSPASSTVETSTENAMGSLPTSPKKQRDKTPQITPPKPRLQSPPLLEETEETEETTSHPVLVALPPNSESMSHPLPDSQVSERSEAKDNPHDSGEPTSPSRGLWRWANVGTGTFGIIKRIPHPDWKAPLITSKTATSAVNGALEGGDSVGSFDDFSIPSSIITEPENKERRQEVAEAKVEGLGIASSVIDPSFSQTKGSSSDLVASLSIQGTPSPRTGWDEQWADGDDSIDSMISNISIPASNGSPPATPSPAQRPIPPKPESKDTPSPQRIPKFKIALSRNILSQHAAATT